MDSIRSIAAPVNAVHLPMSISYIRIPGEYRLKLSLFHVKFTGEMSKEGTPCDRNTEVLDGT